MIVKSEKLIQDAEVLVYVTVYNHEENIAQALESVYSQVTSFGVIVAICDDCSTDGTRAIIQQYYKENEDRTILILNEQNLYSQKQYNLVYKSIKTLPRVKYVAFLEGDDFFLSEKLQEQYDVLENRREVSLCTHLTILSDVISGEEILFPSDKRIVTNISSVSELEYICIMRGNFFSANSFMFRSEYVYDTDFDNEFWNCYAGDIACFLFLLTRGDAYCINKVLSVKRKNNKGSLSFADTTKTESIEIKIGRIDARIRQLDYYDKMTKYKHHVAVKNKIILYKYEKMISLGTESLTIFGGYGGITYPSFASCKVGSFIHKRLSLFARSVDEKERLDARFIQRVYRDYLEELENL